MRSRRVVLYVVLFALNFAIWKWYSGVERDVNSLWVLGVPILLGVGVLVVCGISVRGSIPRVGSMLLLIVTLDAIIFVYSYVYYLVGAGDNEAFNVPLGHADSFYFTVSTLTTAGFGDIHPVNKDVRLLVSSQMLIDLAFVGVAATVLVSRFARRQRQKPRDLQ
jgi:voltage-gated potassium channel